MLAEASAKSAAAYVTDDTHNAYLTAADASKPKGHLVNQFMRTRVASVAFDELSPGGDLVRLYEQQALAEVVRRITEQDRVFHSADPLGRCSINVFRSGWNHAWHFDESEFTTTLMLQTAEQGGAFQFTPWIRRDRESLAEEPLEKILAGAGGAEDLYDDLAFEPGTLSIFAGRYCLHRVTETAGDRERLVAVFTFASEPGFVNTPETQKLFWGRASQEPLGA
mmetsp:Transcript_8348/g.23976  ORF Transcript_8348/g.23976 Transcript_8348/m.23976 type:complete len:223 (+) Transcript_8348:121-789(+)